MLIADRRLGGKNGIGRYALEVSAPTDFLLGLAASFANQGSQAKSSGSLAGGTRVRGLDE